MKNKSDSINTFSPLCNLAGNLLYLFYLLLSNNQKKTAVQFWQQKTQTANKRENKGAGSCYISDLSHFLC